MVTVTTFKKIALSLPEVSEQPHFEKTSFRVGKRIFATLAVEKRLACVKLSETDQSVFCAYDRTVIFPVPNKWGKQGWTLIDLEKVRKDMLTDALNTAYKEVLKTKSVKKMTNQPLARGAIYLPPNAGRHYNLGRMRAVFKADEEETSARYCISEWWLDPHTAGPGAHKHEGNHDIFYVIEGSPSILIGEDWITATKGSFVLIPENTTHDFANRSDDIAGLLNFFIPGGFERNMESVVSWFKGNRDIK